MKKVIPVFCLSVFLLSCHLEPSIDELVETMVVQTRPDENTAFSFYTSFTLNLDTIGYISNRSQDTLAVGSYVKNVANAIKIGMAGKGYTYLTSSQNPDLGFATYIVENYSVSQTVTYPSYYYGYYGYGYGGYYGVPYVSTYVSSSTTLIINLIDLKNRDSQGRLKIIWTAFIGDIAKSNDQTGKVVEAIQQAFTQSTYLHKP